MRCWLALLGSLSLSLAALADEPLELTTLGGEPHRLSLKQEQRALVVHFWATWCPSCVEELGGLDRAAQSCSEGGVEVVAVNVGEDEETIRRYWSEQGLALPALRDAKGRVWRSISGVGLPVNLVWTQAGRRVELGPRDSSAWQTELAQLGCAPASEPEARP